jgi:hypothetical protein
MADKYTATEWATMEGGHSLDTPKQAPFSFIKDMHEARMTRSTGTLKSLTYTDCCERLYLSVLILEALNQYAYFRRTAGEYARRTTGYDTFKAYRMSGTDLYNFAYFVNGTDEAMNKLKDPSAAKAMRQRTFLPLMQLNGWLKSIASNHQYTQTSQFLIKLEGALNITNADYKIVRRNLTRYKSLSTKDKQNTITRLLIAARAKLRTSDLVDDLGKLSATNDLETARVADNEPTVSVPDISTDARDINLYRYIVGTENVMRTRNFLNLAKQGKSVPSQFVQGYVPAVKMLDDIVKAGPAYINLLRALHQRAKKSRK